MFKEPGCLWPILVFTLGPLIFAGLGLAEGMSQSEQATSFGIFAILCFILAFFLSEKIEKGEVKLKKTIAQTQKNISLKVQKEKDSEIYKEAKKNSKYLSDEFLSNELNDQNINIMTRLAYEEILVERGILKSSKTHEELAKLKNKAKD